MVQGYSSARRRRRSGGRRRARLPVFGSVTAAEAIAAILSVMWLLAVGGWLVLFGGSVAPGAATGFVITLIAVFMPVAMFWVAAAAARSSRIMREELERLQAAIDAIRSSYMEGRAADRRPTVEAKLDEIARSARKTETALTTFASIRHPPEPARANTTPAVLAAHGASGEPQGSLALGTPAEALAAPVAVSDFLSALNFPENADDTEGFRALRRALHDRQTARLINAAQAVLHALAEDGIYMDDLKPDRARPEVWRRFAAGERGRAVAGLGGVRDRSSLALAAGRMRQDPAFREAVHQFLRRFDETLIVFEPRATDADLVQLSDTRTARAFMLLGRVTGTFA